MLKMIAELKKQSFTFPALQKFKFLQTTILSKINIIFNLIQPQVNFLEPIWQKDTFL